MANMSKPSSSTFAGVIAGQGKTLTEVLFGALYPVLLFFRLVFRERLEACVTLLASEDDAFAGSRTFCCSRNTTNHIFCPSLTLAFWTISARGGTHPQSAKRSFLWKPTRVWHILSPTVRAPL